MKYKPVHFFLLAYLFTWTAWLTAAYFSYQSGGRAAEIISFLEPIGLFGPFVASLWLIFTSRSKELKQDYFRRLWDLRSIKLSTVPAILLTFPVIMALAVVLSHLLWGKPLSQLTIPGTATFTAGLLPIPVMLFGAALMEELGWKGYGVDSLRGKRTFFTATLIFSLLWVSWHLPLFAINGYYHNLILRMNPLFALNFFLSVIPVAFISNWLWYKNKGNILTAALFHAACNFQGLFQLRQATECIETILLLVVVIILVWLDRRTFFGEFPSRIGDYG